MKLRSAPLLALSAAAIVVFGLTANPTLAGKGGGGGGNGGGNSGGGDRGNSSDRGGGLSKASSQSKASKTRVTTNAHSGSRGAVASNLKKVNGAIHASDTAWANASANGVPGIARTYAEAQAGIDGFDGNIDELLLDKEALETATSVEDYQQMIDDLALESFPDGSADGYDEVAYEAELDRLEGLRDDPETLTEAEIGTELGLVQDQLDEYEGYEQAKDDALESLIGDRELSPEAMAELEARVDAYLASEQYLATVETAEQTTVEEVPAE